MSACVDCGRDCSGLGFCDSCGKDLCFLCHHTKEFPNGTAALCERHKDVESVENPRWEKEAPMSLPLPNPLTLSIHYSVYPGQPMVCAAAQVQVFKNLDEAAAPAHDKYGHPLGFYKAEGHADCPGAGSHNTYAINCMMQYREHRDIDRLFADLHEMWKRSAENGYKDRIQEGLEKAKLLEPALRELLPAWIGE